MGLAFVLAVDVGAVQAVKLVLITPLLGQHALIQGKPVCMVLQLLWCHLML